MTDPTTGASAKRFSNRNIGTEEAYQKSLEILASCQSEPGFLATTTNRDNYRRIWGRDSMIIGLASLLTGDADGIDCCRRSIMTLAEHQGPHGEIPSNVDPSTGRVSYGGTAGRVDADLWFLICLAEYWKITGDDTLLDQILPHVERVRWLLGAWEFNTRGLLYIPPTGDWADEYIHSGYVLYDQVLYYQAQCGLAEFHRHLHGSADHDLVERISRLRHLIRKNYWFHDEGDSSDIYHEVLYRKGRQAAPRCQGEYWMPFFSPLGYGYRFDAMANVLVSLLGIADQKQSDKVDRYIVAEVVDPEVLLLPAFSPVITPKDEDWAELQMTFSHSFKNAPYEYHNGGLWPLVTGFYAADLARRNKLDLAKAHLQAVHNANCLEMNDEAWAFPEYVHGKKLTPGGTSHMGWSAAAAIIAHQYLQGHRLFEPSTGPLA